MKTEVTFIYQTKRYKTLVNARNTSSAPATLFLLRPHLRNRCTIINVIGGSTINHAGYDGPYQHNNHTHQ